MKRMMTMGLILIIASAIPSYAELGHDGNYLLHACAGKTASAKTQEAMLSIFGANMWCMGFLDGVVDMNTLYSQILLGGKDGAFCLPEQEIPNDQLSRIVVKFLEDNPKILHQSARILAVMAFHDAFPCKAPSGSTR